MTDLDNTDADAVALIGTYAGQGEFALIIRTNGSNTHVRVIGPSADVTVLSRFLQLAAETLFNGPNIESIKVN